MSKQTNHPRTCFDCMHCQACHLWSIGAISDSVAPKCPQFEPARYVTLAELQDLHRMYKGELVPVVRCRECKHYRESAVYRHCALHKGLAMVTPDSFCSYGERRE